MNHTGQTDLQFSAIPRRAVTAFLWLLCLFIEQIGPIALAAPPAAPLPDGKGKAEFIHNCTACHRADLVTRVPKTPEDWKKNVFEMASRGTDGTKADLDNVVLYLDTFFAKNPNAPAAAATPSQAPPQAAGNSLQPSINSDPIKQLIAQNLCLTCHRIEQQGAYLGPSLNGVSSRLTDGQIKSAIVTPPPTLGPSERLVKLITPEGKSLTGRILSQDDHQVRVIAASGEIATYEKALLQQFSVVDFDPMPSYKTKLSLEDLNSLVRYLGNLPPVDESASK